MKDVKTQHLACAAIRLSRGCRAAPRHWSVRARGTISSEHVVLAQVLRQMGVTYHGCFPCSHQFQDSLDEPQP